MTRLLYLYLGILFITIHGTEQLSCGYNEDVEECPSKCASDHCPTSERQEPPCPRPKECGEPECRCRFNTRRSENGTCIPSKECPPFKCDAPNTEYVSCPSYYPGDDCSQSTSEGGIPAFGSLLFVVECVPKCKCISGYWKHKGICVPFNECPQNKQ